MTWHFHPKVTLTVRYGMTKKSAIHPLPTSTTPQTPKPTAKEALEMLEQAWAYYTPEPSTVQSREPEFFEYANAA